MPIVYENEAKMLNGHNSDVPPELDKPQMDGEIGIGRVGIVEEVVEAIVVGDAAFDGPRIFYHGLRYEWRPEVHVMG